MILGLCGFCKKEFRKREQKYKFCSIPCSNRFNLNGLSKVELPSISSDLAEFVGICLGDGYVSKYQVSVTLNSIADKDYVSFVADLSRSLFRGATVSIMPNRRENSIDIRVNSRTAAQFLYDMGIVANAKSVPRWIVKNPTYIKACIRGLFDTEGSISFKQYISRKGINIYKQLNFRNSDEKLMLFVRDNLVLLGLKPTMTLKKSLYLSNHQSIAIYRDLVGFSNPKLFKKSFITNIEQYNNIAI